MSKDVPSLAGSSLYAERAVVLRLPIVNGGAITMTVQQAEKLYSMLESGPDAVEAFLFLLKQAVDGINACDAQDELTLSTWLKTQPERP